LILISSTNKKTWEFWLSETQGGKSLYPNITSNPSSI